MYDGTSRCKYVIDSTYASQMPAHLDVGTVDSGNDSGNERWHTQVLN